MVGFLPVGTGGPDAGNGVDGNMVLAGVLDGVGLRAGALVFDADEAGLGGGGAAAFAAVAEGTSVGACRLALEPIVEGADVLDWTGEVDVEPDTVPATAGSNAVLFDSDALLGEMESCALWGVCHGSSVNATMPTPARSTASGVA